MVGVLETVGLTHGFLTASRERKRLEDKNPDSIFAIATKHPLQKPPVAYARGSPELTLAMPSTELIERLHAAPAQAVLAISGGGSGAIERLLSVSGASATVLEAVVPYALAALTDWLGSQPEQACSEWTARQMAMRAFERARCLGDKKNEKDLIGIGCTASLRTNRPHRGEHRIHVAAQTSSRTLSLHLLLEKSRRTRAEEEAIATHAVIAVLADAAGVKSIDLTKTPAGIEPTLDSVEAPTEWSELLLSHRQSVGINGATNSLRLLLPGSFHPMHEGHQEMMRLAEEQTGHTGVYELSLGNVDKPPLDFIEIKRRIEGLEGRPLLLTSAVTFADKAQVVPGCLFAVGADTAVRIGKVAYYNNDPAQRDEAIAQIGKQGCRFLVFGREAEGGFQELDDLNLPPALKALCDGVPATDFRCDLSSTSIRNGS